jgi:glycosyltransferase involved in cell wall biosynthesis
MTAREIVSVIIPSYNAELYLREAVESALAQSYPHIEVVVVDDGSTDGTAAVINSFGQRVRAVNKPNGGTASARNAGARAATGVWSVFLDADDRLHPTFVEACLAHLRQHPEASYVYTQERFFGTADYVSQYPQFDAGALVDTNYVNPSALLPMALVKAHPFNEVQRTHEDWDFYLGLLREGHSGILLDEVLKDYRRHPGAKQEVAGRNHVQMPYARLRIHWRHRRQLRGRLVRTFAGDLIRILKGLVTATRTGIGARRARVRATERRD